MSNGDSNKEKENNTVNGRKEDKPEMGGRRERESRDYLHACLRYNVWLSHHRASSCECMCTYLIQRVCKECVSLMLPFPL